MNIRTGEEFLLLKKSTSEWWYVIRHGDKKPIYVSHQFLSVLCIAEHMCYLCGVESVAYCLFWYPSSIKPF